MSEATLATSFEVATPTEAVRPVSRWISSFTRRATTSPGPRARAEAVTSRKASSMDTGSTRSVTRRRMSMTRSDSWA